MTEYGKGCYDVSEETNLKRDMVMFSKMLDMPLEHVLLMEILLKLDKLTEKNEKADQE